MKNISITYRNRLLQLGDSTIKKLFLLVLFFNISIGYSQGEISTELPEIIPPSPTVASLMKFEEMPVDYYTGIPDISVPLISTPIDSKLNLNIALNYHPSGIRVDEYASWVGTGWSLSGAGGVITRMVKGAPDELGIFINNYYNSAPDQNVEVFREISYDALYVGGSTITKNDTQSDVFHFSFLGHSGKFIFTKNSSGNFVAVDLTGTSNLKINYTLSTLGNVIEKFVITDENGYNYTFEAKELSIISSTTGTTHWVGDPQLSSGNQSYISAWHLSKIESHTGQLLCEFSYETITEKTRSVSNKKNELYPIEQIQSILPATPPMTAHRENLLPITEAGNYLSEISTQKITEINITGRSKILFENTKGRLDYEQNSGCKLSRIVLKNNQNHVINTYSLVYTNQGGGSRLFLDELKTYGQDGIAYDSHKFDYKNASNLPERFSLRTDLWGYYNNIANQTLFPHFTFSPSSGTADKSTRPEFVTTGVLTGIEYPTGGYKEFEFESNTYAVVTSEPDRKYDHPGNNNLHLTLAQFKFDPTPSGSNVLNNKIIHQDLSNLISFLLNVTEFNPNANLSAYKVRLIPLNPNYNYTGVISQDINDYQIDSSKLPLEFSLDDCGVNIQQCAQSFYIQGFYLITMSNNGIILENDDVVSYSVSCSFFEYVENYKYSYGGGLRIKTIGFKDKKDDLDYKRKYSYSYQDFADNTKSSGSIHAFPVYSYPITRKFAQETTGTLGTVLKEESATYMVVHSKPLISYIPNNGSMVGYKHVLVKDSDEGYVKYYYSSPEDFTGYQPSYPYFEITKNNDYQKGLLMKSEYYDENNAVKKSIENFYEYSSSVIFGGRNVYMPQHFNCYIQNSSFSSFVKNYDSYKFIQSNYIYNFGDGSCSMGGVESLFHHFNAEYTKGKSELSRVKTLEYNTDGLIENNVYYTYNNLNHKVFKERRNLTNEFTESLYFYPLDTQMSGKPNVSSLISNNIISTPLVVQTFRNSTKLSEVEAVYKNWGNNLLAPEYIKTSKGDNTLENRIRYEKYDDKGNPIQVKQENGTPIVYLWGYNQAYPIAKIENATYDEVVAALGTNNISETNLSAINALRTNSAFANAMITTYTYKPLVGVTSITDPRGYTTTYHYDNFNRLEFVRDAAGNILERTQYNYQN